MYIFFKTFTVVSFFIVLNFVLLFLSNIFLSFNEVYITEQDRVSYYNNNYLLILLSIILFFLTWYIFYKKNEHKIATHHSLLKKYPHKNLNNTLLISMMILLLISYVNILILSDIPPLLKDGYINRIGYLETTKLWLFIKPFGAILIIVPIVLGYLKASNYYNSEPSKLLNFIFIFYILYLLLIGQKFSGMAISIFYFILPQLILMIQQGKKILTFKQIIIGVFIVSFFFLFLIYHYSKNPIALEMGGPIKFIFYRIFALQGHMSWGYYNAYDLLTFEPFNMYNAMQNMMRAVGEPSIVDSMISRNVNFTGAFPTIVFFSFPMGINLLILLIIYYIYITFSFFLLRSIDTIYYVFYAYILNYFITYFSRGSIEEILNFKVLGLLILMFIIKMLITISSRKKHANVLA